MSSIIDIATILAAQAEGCDVIEIPSADGGIFVTDEVLQISVDLEEVSRIGFSGDLKEAMKVMLAVMRRALTPNESGSIEDPFEAVQDWINGWLDLDQKVETA